MTLLVSHVVDWLLAHSSLQRCFNSLRLASINLFTGLFAYHQSILVRLTSGFWLGHCDSLTLFFSAILIQVCCCACDHFPFSWHLFNQVIAVGEIARPLTLSTYVYRGVQGWFNNCKVPRQKKPKSSHFHHHAWQLVWDIYAAILYFSQFSLVVVLCIMARIKNIVPERNLVVWSDIILQT